MNTICFYFEIHQPSHLRRYRFFDIGNDHYYYDDRFNEENITRLAHCCYLPATRMFLDLIKETGGKFHFALSVSGIALDLLEHYAPEVIDNLKELAKTGCVEFLGETYAHSLVSLRGDDEFELQVREHSQKIQALFGQTPKVLRNTELIYSNGIGQRTLQMGFNGIVTEGDKRFMGWHSPNYVYCCSSDPRLKILTRNSSLSNDITFRFSDWNWDQFPLTADKYMGWVANAPEQEQVTSLFMNLETIGDIQRAESGIFDFFKALPKFAKEYSISFLTPSEVLAQFKPIDQLRFDNPISWADEERDASAWLGNELQSQAFEKVSSLGERVRMSQNQRLLVDWYYLQSSDHFYYMSTKHFGNGIMHASPFSSPYDAFINYMNVLNDFISMVNEQFPNDVDGNELNNMRNTINEQEEMIENLKVKIKSLEGGAKKEEVKTVKESKTETPKAEVKTEKQKKAASKKK